MLNLPEEFVNWYNSLEYVNANKGPANGSIATSLVVLNRLIENYKLDYHTHVAERGTQVKGASGKAVAAILSNFGEIRPFAKEGGRTNRGALSAVKSLLNTLQKLNLENRNTEERNLLLKEMQIFLVEKVKDFHNRQKIKLEFNHSTSTWHVISNLLKVADLEKKSGFVAQHLVGAKLQLRYPEITVINQPTNAADNQTQRPGDFLIGDTAFHVTVSPMNAVYEKCQNNIFQGYKPFLLVPDKKLIGTRQNAEEFCDQKISVESIESFISQNIDEISFFSKNKLIESIKELIEIYNRRVDEVEFDKSLMIELPDNLIQNG
jgi:hypothetical protein